MNERYLHIGRNIKKMFLSHYCIETCMTENGVFFGNKQVGASKVSASCSGSCPLEAITTGLTSFPWKHQHLLISTVQLQARTSLCHILGFKFIHDRLGTHVHFKCTSVTYRHSLSTSLRDFIAAADWFQSQASLLVLTRWCKSHQPLCNRADLVKMSWAGTESCSWVFGLCSRNLSHADGLSAIGSMWKTTQAGLETLILQHWVRSKGALQVHVDAQASGHQLLLVLLEASKGIEHGRTAPVHPGGKQVAGAHLGCEELVVAHLQVTWNPAVGDGSKQPCERQVYHNCFTY